MNYWILDGHTPVPATVNEWGEFFESPHRFLWETEVGGGVVKTVFFGYDHDDVLTGRGEPLLFGTMVFGEVPHNGHEELYATWDEAEAGHQRVVAEVREAL